MNSKHCITNQSLYVVLYCGFSGEAYADRVFPSLDEAEKYVEYALQSLWLHCKQSKYYEDNKSHFRVVYKIDSSIQQVYYYIDKVSP